jgi:NAD(P)-dependent dehydrogenase (short-subunit alcohol dehydrogenase family)
MFNYKDSTALVTGASAGLGEAFAEELAARGAHVVLVARSGDKLAKLASRLERDYRIKATCIAIDLAAAGAAEEVAFEVKRRDIPVDLLVNNAGFGVFERFLDYPLKKQIAQLDVNVRTLVTLSGSGGDPVLRGHEPGHCPQGNGSAQGHRARGFKGFRSRQARHCPGQALGAHDRLWSKVSPEAAGVADRRKE